MEKFKRGKGARSIEALIQNISEYGSASLLRAADTRGDNRVLLQIKGQDCTAREIKYHRSCYKNYVRLEKLTKLEAQNCATGDKESRGYSKAFGKLCHYLQSEDIIKTRTLNMTKLVGKFVSHLNEEGLNISDYRSSKLKQRLKGAFGKQLDLHKPSDPSQPELVYSANVEKGEIVKSLVSQSDMTDCGLESGAEEIDEQDSGARKDVAHQVYHASKELRNILLDVKPVLSWPPKADELQSDTALVPDMLYNMLAWILEDGVEILPNLTIASAVIVDAMAQPKILPRIPDRFIDLADLILSALIKQAGEARRIDFVADQYPIVSINNIKRERRGRLGQLAVQIRSPQQLCLRQWKKFLSNGLINTNQMEFLADVWGTDQRFAEKIGERTLFVTHGESSSKISIDAQGSISSSTVLELCSNQEEADTRMFLHALHASDAAHQQILIKSSDTDVEVLACYFRCNGASVL